MASDPLADFYYGQLGVPQAYTGAMENLGFQANPFDNQQGSWNSMMNFQKSLKGIMDQQMGAYGTQNPAALPYNLYNEFASAAPIYSNPDYGPIGGGNLFNGQWQNGTDMNNMNWRSKGYQQYIDRVNAPPPPPIASMSTTPGLGSGTGMSNPMVNTPQQNAAHPSATSYTVALQGGGSQTVNAHDLAGALANVSNAATGPNQRVQAGGYQF